MATNADHVALAKLKLLGMTKRTGDLDRLAQLLDDGEEVVTMADALFRTQGIERRGLAVLTDRRLLCVDKASQTTELLEISLAEITACDTGSSGGMGDARRGELTIMADDVPTHLARIHPWERADEIRAALIDSPVATLAA